jgi:hypothetical protein
VSPSISKEIILMFKQRELQTSKNKKMIELFRVSYYRAKIIKTIKLKYLKTDSKLEENE